jgi:hypothetical protein
LSAAIWRNENNGSTFYSVTFERRYKDDAGNWHSSSSFNSSDLLLLAKLADQSHSKIVELRADDRNAPPITSTRKPPRRFPRPARALLANTRETSLLPRLVEERIVITRRTKGRLPSNGEILNDGSLRC